MFFDQLAHWCLLNPLNRPFPGVLRVLAGWPAVLTLLSELVHEGGKLGRACGTIWLEEHSGIAGLMAF